MVELLKSLKPTKCVEVFDGSDNSIKHINFLAGMAALGSSKAGTGNLIAIFENANPDCNCWECSKLDRVKVCKIIYEGNPDEINVEWKEVKKRLKKEKKNQSPK